MPPGIHRLRALLEWTPGYHRAICLSRPARELSLVLEGLIEVNYYSSRDSSPLGILTYLSNVRRWSIRR